MDGGVGVAALQQGRVLARAAAQIPNLARREILGQAHQKIERGAVALGFEAIVLAGIPQGGSVAHVVTTPGR
ncbi:hypothetical protein D3C80_1530950 [compost metagenome]